LSGTQVLSNSASSYGGGVYVDYISAELNVSGGGIDSNSASDDGGGVYVNGGSAALSGTQVVRNSASGNGGGVYVDNSSATLNVGGGEISSNSVITSGGGVFVNQGNVTLNGTQVVRNSADSGGGLYLSSTGAIVATDGCIVYNSDTAVENDSSGTLDARDNWWGMPDGPSGVGPGSGDSVSVNVDYANYKTSPPAGCPMYTSNLTMAKSVTPTMAAPGAAITYTLTFSNAGVITANGVVVSDSIPVSVTHTSVISSGVVITRRGGARYAWEVADLSPGAGGVITITGVLSQVLSAGPFTNTAVITTTAMESDVTNNSDSASVTVSTIEPRHIYLPLVLKN
jgi:uncharacterized repeat protein (TIGR01451 family)